MRGDESSWDSDGLVVVPGFPGTVSAPEDGRSSYPATTLAFVKIMSSAGYPIRTATPEDVREISHHSAEVWLPVLNIGAGILVGAGGNLLADLVLRAVSALPRRTTRLHIKWNVGAVDGSVRTFEVAGDAAAAVDAARSFERSLGSGDDVEQ